MAEIDLTESRVSTRNDYPPLGCLDVQTPRGIVHIHDAPGAMTTVVTHLGSGVRSIGLLVYDPEAPEDKVQGLIAQLSPNSARLTAESLLRLAHELDGGRVDG